MSRLGITAVLLLSPALLNAAEPTLLLRELTGVRRADFNTDASRLLVQLRDGQLGLWNCEEGRPIAGDLGTLTAQGTYVIDADAERALVGFKGGGSRVFDLATGLALSPVMDVSFEGDGFPSAGFSPDGAKIHVFEKTGVCRILEVETGKDIATLSLPAASDDREIESGMEFSEDGGTAFLLDAAGNLRRYDAGSWRESGPPLPHPDPEASHIGFDVSPNSRHAVTFDSPGENGPDGLLQLWDLVESRVLGDPIREVNGVSGQFIDRGDRLLLMPGRGATRVVKIPSLENDFVLPRHDDVEASRATITADGSHLFSWGYDSTVRSLDARTGKQAGVFFCKAQVTDVLPSPGSVWLELDNTAFLLGGHHDHYIVRLDPKKMQPLATLRVTRFLHRTILSPDARRLMIHERSTTKECIRLFDATTLVELPGTDRQ